MDDDAVNGNDTVAMIVRRWHQLRPDLDATSMLVIARIARLNWTIDESLRPLFADAGLANGDFDLLAALRRQGSPYEASPGELALAMLVTTGATTKRIDRLQRQGLVARRHSPSDGRGRIVSLTAAGRELVDELMTAHLANEAAILDHLDAKDRHQLARLLGAFATALESQAPE